MDVKKETLEKLVQIVKFGAVGDAEKVRIQTMRLIRSLSRDGHPLADELKNIVFSQFNDMSHAPPIRKVKQSGISHPPPMDSETHAELLRIDDPVDLSHPFIVSKDIDEQLNGLIHERKQKRKLDALGLSPTRTVLFVGKPGVGKTMAAKKIAAELKLPLLTLDLATVISSLLGKTGNNLKAALDFARSRPCVLLLDEIDAIAKRRDDAADIGELKRLVTVILQELDLWPESNLLIAATNHADLLDPAVERRFEQIVSFSAPSQEELKKLGNLLIHNSNGFSKKWSHVLAQLLAGSSYSDFTRELNKLRRTHAIYGEKSMEAALSTTINHYLDHADIGEKKQLAKTLVQETKLTQRAASRLTGIARDTLRAALSS